MSAHPFELLAGFGGSIAMLTADGARVSIVSVGGPDAALRATGGSETPLLKAFAELGVAEQQVVRLGIPAAAITSRVGEITRRLGFLVQGFELCAAPWCDDRAAASGAVRWASLLACSLRQRPPLVEYLAGAADGTRKGKPWHRAAWIPLPAEAARAKERAVGVWLASVSKTHRPAVTAANGTTGHELIFR
ncbi:hypothetical protein LN042_02060 [Kitasatospora sp. RB6PN24]|uniref:hypothetical protein n=1 Tax=Kitasatospora humi TaxID=2893891 RepID=UPI001E49FFA1|nr:hypothetical protein [Kitasatospora humi]MCC9305902.1 hypothetical protein [Kitasatospora humi]